MKSKQQAFIAKDLKRKMVFLTDPRQVGKTSLTKAITEGYANSVYLNYDSFSDRKIIEDLA